MLGEEAFESFGTRGPRVALLIVESSSGDLEWTAASLDASSAPGTNDVLVPGKIEILKRGALVRTDCSTFLSAPGHRILFAGTRGTKTLRDQADSYQGLKTGDDARLRQFFWETPGLANGWLLAQGGSTEGGEGLHYVVRWGRKGESIARAQGQPAWGHFGVAISRTRNLGVSRYLGVPFFSEIAAIVPHREDQLGSLWRFASTGELERRVRQIDTATILSNGTFLDVPCDLDEYADASVDLDQRRSQRDPTQWLFEGWPAIATEPLQVAVGRLAGFRWPEQPEADDLDALVDGDGILCLPSVLGERSAATRLQELLARAFGGTWSPARTGELLAAAGSKKKDLESWLRDEFFKAHCQVFKSRPFVWQIWDGRRDGFSALVNYHRLDRSTLERLTYTYLGDWIERQTAGVREDVAGAEERLAAAQDLQRRLQLILDGEPPYDLFVRWKPLAEQPIGWDPDPNDGVRLNLRPFVEAGVLRSTFNVKWDKDRGKNSDGSERLNDLHYTRASKEAACNGPRT